MEGRAGARPSFFNRVSVRACLKTRPVRAPGLQNERLSPKSCRPRAPTRRPRVFFKQGLNRISEGQQESSVRSVMFFGRRSPPVRPSPVGNMPLLRSLTCLRKRRFFERLILLQRLEDIALVMLYLKLLEKLKIFLAERFARMVFYLIPDVADHAGQLRVAIRKCSETLLPTETPHDPPVLI